ncbi:MAG: carboxypeptidase regulatory-like domain-containing protein [Bacteroidales bacterium]
MSKLEIKLKAAIFLASLLILAMFNMCTEEPFDPDIKGSVEGIVMDDETNEPLRNATIQTKPSTEVILTDSSGYYKISMIDTGRYNVTAERTNYNTKTLGILIKEDHTSTVNFLLKKKDQTSGNNDVIFSKKYTPTSGADNLSTELTLKWNAYCESEDESISYDVLLYRSNSLHQKVVAENIQDTSLKVTNLRYNQVYYWQVIAKNSNGDTTHGELLNFKTKSIPENSFFFVKRMNGNFELMAYDLDSAVINRLTYNNNRDWAPKLNKQNGKLAFVSDSLVKPYIFIMDKSGGQSTRVTEVAADGYHNDGNAFAWYEDEGRIIFSHYHRLYSINVDGTGLRTIATAPSDRHFREIDISPDNSKIVALTIGERIYNSEIYLMDIDGSNQEVLVDSLKGITEAPTFSVDGNSILYTHDVSENESLDGRMLNSQIFRYDLGTGETTSLSENKPTGTNDLTPRYSPTGDKIIFTNVVNNNSKPKEIWMMDIDGTNREKVVDDAELPFWN